MSGLNFHELTYMPMELWTIKDLQEWADFLSDKMEDKGPSSSDTARLEIVLAEIDRRGVLPIYLSGRK